MEKQEIIQYYLNKLISEEWFAGNMYLLFKKTVRGHKIASFFRKELQDIGKDELDDHYAKLIKYAKRFNYEFPACYNEFLEYAGEGDSRAFNAFKSRRCPKYYLKQAVDSEHRAIESYKSAIKAVKENLNNDEFDVKKFMEVIKNNYKDELDHDERFSTLLSKCLLNHH